MAKKKREDTDGTTQIGSKEKHVIQMDISPKTGYNGIIDR
jgi:hypothetical protein